MAEHILEMRKITKENQVFEKSIKTREEVERLVPARPRVISDGRSSLVLHGVLMSVRTCSSQSWCPRSGAYRYAEFL